jgi:hypothetical protein
MFKKCALVESSVVMTNDGMIGICCPEVNAVIFSNAEYTEKILTEIKNDSESDYKKWGGKRGFMKYLLTRILKEDRYFNKNKNLININNKRYQDFCDDVALYEVVKSVVTGDPMSAINKEDADLEWSTHK